MRLPIRQPLSLSKNHVIARSEATWQSPKDLDTHLPSPLGRVAEQNEVGRGVPEGHCCPCGATPLPSQRGNATPCHLPLWGRLFAAIRKRLPGWAASFAYGIGSDLLCGLAVIEDGANHISQQVRVIFSPSSLAMASINPP